MRLYFSYTGTCLYNHNARNVVRYAPRGDPEDFVYNKPSSGEKLISSYCMDRVSEEQPHWAILFWRERQWPDLFGDA